MSLQVSPGLKKYAPLAERCADDIVCADQGSKEVGAFDWLIRTNVDKLRHIKTQVLNYDAHELLNSTGKARYLDKSFNPVVFKELGIDWDYIGLSEYFVQMHFSGELSSNKKLDGVRIVFGRDSIYVKLNESDARGVSRNYDEAKHMEMHLSNGVAVFCSTQ